jgi:flagellar basal body-associated protein FliL
MCLTTHQELSSKNLIMAEIHVEAKKKTTPVWIWVVLALVILGVIIYFAVRNKRSGDENAVNKQSPTSYISQGNDRVLPSI